MPTFDLAGHLLEVDFYTREILSSSAASQTFLLQLLASFLHSLKHLQHQGCGVHGDIPQLPLHSKVTRCWLLLYYVFH